MTETQILWCIIIAQQIMLCVLYVFSEWSHRVGILIGHACSMRPGSFPKARAIINKSLAKFGLPLIAVLLACIAASAEIPRNPEPVRDTVHKIELNRVYDDAGNPRLTQVIFDDPTEMVAWRMYKPSMLLSTNPPVVIWQDGETLREVRARWYEETHTQTDREVDERAYLPVCQRRELSVPKARAK